MIMYHVSTVKLSKLLILKRLKCTATLQFQRWLTFNDFSQSTLLEHKKEVRLHSEDAKTRTQLHKQQL